MGSKTVLNVVETMLKHVFGGCKNEQKSTKEMLKYIYCFRFVAQRLLICA